MVDSCDELLHFDMVHLATNCAFTVFVNLNIVKRGDSIALAELLL